MKSRVWLVLIGLPLVALAGLIYLFSRPSHGHQVAVDLKPQSKLHVATANANLPATSVHSAYFQLDLPTGYRPQAPQTVPGLLFSQTLTKPSTLGSLIITISVKSLPEGGLGEDSSYRARQQQSERYHISSQTFDAETVQIANDSVDAAVVAFWPHRVYLATISVSSGLGNPGDSENSDELRALQPLLQAWRWR